MEIDRKGSPFHLKFLDDRQYIEPVVQKGSRLKRERLLEDEEKENRNSITLRKRLRPSRDKEYEDSTSTDEKGHFQRERIDDSVTNDEIIVETLWDRMKEWEVKSGYFETGIEKLDEILGGGIFTGEVLEIVGRSAIGKTQLCFTVSTHFVATRADSLNVIYIDTTNSFSPRRIYEIYHNSNAKEKNPFGESMKRIRVSKVSNPFALNAYIDKLDMKISANEEFYGDVKLIVIDSLSNILSQHLGSKKYIGHALMAETGRAIKNLAFRHHVAILTTCETVTGPDNTLKPALGKSWTYFADKRISMDFLKEDPAKRHMMLTTSNTTVIGRVCNFKIADSGIQSEE